jgi:acyl-CoA synthetase (AMP-forming)/AMP-acid ligase II
MTIDALARVIANWRGRIDSPQESLARPVDAAAIAQLISLDATGLAQPIVATALPGATAGAATAHAVLWQAGYCSAPLDLRLDVAGNARRLALLRPELVLVDAEHRDEFGRALEMSGCSARLVALGPDPNHWPAIVAPRADIVDSDLALIVFTSGTTGTPRGVPLTRANILAAASNVVAAQRLTANDRVLNALPFCHVNSPIIALLATILSGGSIVLLPKFTPRSFWQTAATAEVTWANLVPTFILLLARNADSNRNPTPPSLRFVRSASAPLLVQIHEDFERAFGLPVVQSYGISEAASQVTIDDVPPLPRTPGSVGRPWGIEVSIVNDHGEAIPIGETGEVIIAGPTVMTSYLNAPEASEASHVGRWLRTGDLGTLDESGRLRIVGRLKEIINRGGEKVSPYAIEEVLQRHPAVGEVAAISVPDDVYGEEIKAIVVPRSSTGVDLADLRAYAHAHLPRLMRPRYWEVVEALPRSPMGKIVRRQPGTANG